MTSIQVKREKDLRERFEKCEKKKKRNGEEEGESGEEESESEKRTVVGIRRDNVIVI